MLQCKNSIRIEPQWNVNSGSVYVLYNKEKIRIEPQWNVNMGSEGTLEMSI